LISESNSPSRAKLLVEAMSKAKDGVKEIPPLPKGNAFGGKTTLVDGASNEFRVEQLSSELKQLKL
jgi:hypothetical protein